MGASYGEWAGTFRGLYGEHATRAVWGQHRRFGSAGALGPDGAAALYRGMVPQEARHSLGEYFTPQWLADFTLDRLGAGPGSSLVDPSAGLGVFVERAGARGLKACGYEINPVTAGWAQRAGFAVEVRDTLADPGERRFDFVAGNPPWVNWRHLNYAYRRRIEGLWVEYGLVPQGRMGAAMDDLSILFTYHCAQRLLAAHGRMALILSRTLFQSAGGGRLFRRFELPGGRFLRVEGVHEIEGGSAFEGASTRAVVAVFEVSKQPTTYPVAYFRDGQRWSARPVGRDRTSAWSVTRGERDWQMMTGESAYRPRVGAHSGGASGVFWVDVLERSGGTVIIRNRSDAGRTAWPQVTAEVEPDLVRRLVRGRDVSDEGVKPSCSIVLPHGEDGRPVFADKMRDRWPKTFAYFEQFRERMLERPHYRQHFARRGFPYWSLYNVGAYTFARHRVVWREQDRTLRCAVIDRADWTADAKLVVVPCESREEARYLAALLNSRPARDFVESYALRTQISTHVLRYLSVPKFDAGNRLHAELAASETTVSKDELAAELWRFKA